MSAAAALGYSVLSAAQVVPRWPLCTAYTTLGHRDARFSGYRGVLLIAG